MKKYRKFAGLVVLSFTALLFAFYWHNHPKILSSLKTVSPSVIITVVGLYAVMMVVLVAIYDLTLKICNSTIPIKEHAMLTMYSSIANFFGPLQSGPGVRSVYLKTRYRIKFSDYAAATIIYYLMFGGWSGLFLLTGIRPWWRLALLIIIGITAVGVLLVSLKKFKLIKTLINKSSLTLLVKLAALTFVQVMLVSLIYATELKSINSQVSFTQVITYTGAANFALFVSLTPGALGFRESFLFFSQRLHHISGDNIIVANLIDRSAYVAFLGLVFLVIMAVHASSRLAVKPVDLG